MPRPSPEQRRKIEANKLRNAKIRVDMEDRDRRIIAKVQSITDDALAISKRASLTLPDLASINEKLEKAFALATIKELPQCMANIAMMQARLAGLIVDRQAIMHANIDASVLHGEPAEQRQAIIQGFAEKHGAKQARLLTRLLPGRESMHRARR